MSRSRASSYRTPFAICAVMLLPVCALLLLAAPRVEGADRLDAPVLREGDILTAPLSNRRSIAVRATLPLWSDGIVPYRIDPALSIQSVAEINKAIDHWNAISAVTLQPAAPTDRDLVVFQPGSGCASWVGRQGGAQEIWVAPSCSAGSMMHEIGHALGLEHEHTRPDRDQYITIHWDNIDVEKQHNFDVAPGGSRMVGDYDYGSIMHYGPNNFSLDGGPTITPLFAVSGSIGQRRSPSAGDIASIARLYRADLSLVSDFAQAGNNTDLTLHVTNNHEQGAHGIEVGVRHDGADLLDHAGEGWVCRVSGIQQSTCLLERLSGSGNSVLQLTLSGLVTEASVVAQVSSKTPDKDLLNNGSGSGYEPALAAALAGSALQDDPVVIITSFGGGALGPVGLLLPLLLLLHRRRYSTGKPVAGSIGTPVTGSMGKPVTGSKP